MGICKSKSMTNTTFAATARDTIGMRSDLLSKRDICLQKESIHASHRDTRCSAVVLSEHASGSECQEELSEHSHGSNATTESEIASKPSRFHMPHRQVMSFEPASTPPPAVQVGPGTFGGKERFSLVELTAGPGEYNLPKGEISGAGNFGQMTGDRFETIELTAGPGEYKLPKGEISGAGNFGQMTGKRFEEPENTPGAGDYDLPAETTVCNAVFSKSQAERFEDSHTPVVGPGKYELPQDQPSPCSAKFLKASRGLAKRQKQRVGPGSYNPKMPKQCQSTKRCTFNRSRREMSYVVQSMW